MQLLCLAAVLLLCFAWPVLELADVSVWATRVFCAAVVVGLIAGCLGLF
jgi:hypothetical protein